MNHKHSGLCGSSNLSALLSFLFLASGAIPSPVLSQVVRSGNPILQGWYADPEAHVFESSYWIYPTYSAPYDDQLHMDAFSSPDLSAIGWFLFPGSPEEIAPT